jgi:hypothetical protein
LAILCIMMVKTTLALLNHLDRQIQPASRSMQLLI